MRNAQGMRYTSSSMQQQLPEEELQRLLLDIMDGIHSRCIEYGTDSTGYCDYVKGANIAGFKKVADAMLAYGVV